MARGTLHAKKENGRNRNGTPHETKHYARDGRVRGPEIEEATGRDGWPPMVRKWWQTWREAPQARDFEATDWMRLAILAPFVEAVLARPSAAALAEIRMNEERLGATVTDRMRARITIEPRDEEDEDAPLAPVAPIGRKRGDV